MGVLTPGAGSAVAWAEAPQHVKSPFELNSALPAGQFCDFDMQNVGPGSDNMVIFPDKAIDQIEIQIAYTNLATGFTLTETDRLVVQFTTADADQGGRTYLASSDCRWKDRGGPSRAVGGIRRGRSSQVYPGINQDETAVICPALRGIHRTRNGVIVLGCVNSSKRNTDSRGLHRDTFFEESGEAPSLLAKKGETVTVSAERTDISRSHISLRPLTISALRRVFGSWLGQSARLSDSSHFQTVEELEGLIDFSKPDEDARIAGLTAISMHNILSVLDPDEPMPDTITWPSTTRKLSLAENRKLVALEAAAAGHTEIQIPLPGVTAQLSAHIPVVQFLDNVVEPRSTLVLDNDLRHLWASNFIAYNGAKIVQKSDHLSIEVTQRLCGGLMDLNHYVKDNVLHIDFKVIDAFKCNPQIYRRVVARPPVCRQPRQPPSLEGRRRGTRSGPRRRHPEAPRSVDEARAWRF